MADKIIRVLLVDDHQVVRRGLRTFLEIQDDIEVVGEASDGAEGVARTEELRPDVVLMDIKMPVLPDSESRVVRRDKSRQKRVPRRPTTLNVVPQAWRQPRERTSRPEHSHGGVGFPWDCAHRHATISTRLHGETTRS
ncbi:Protein-glutamate methylesterase/protein-glutamine glutaminase [Streptomyces microflavus]